MAFVDSATQNIVVRVVYDGPAMAGKTTNVRELYDAFRGRRRSELLTPGQAGDRTCFMDWLQVDTGLVSGRNLSCHFITVPGQKLLVRRRKLLLGVADTVVFVCSAEPRALAENREAFDFLRAELGARTPEIPLVVQLNKVDHPDAIDVNALRAALDLGPEVRVTVAQANEGTGVRETAILALRAAADRVQSMVLRSGFEALDDPTDDAEGLARSMRRAEADSSSLLDARVLLGAPDEITTEAREIAPETALGEPELPHPDVASGLIWPANDGRDLLRRAFQLEPERTTTEDAERVVFEAGMWSLGADRSTLYPDLDRAKSALLRAVRRSLQLGELRFGPLCLCLAPAHGGYWLWRVAPSSASIRDGIEHALRVGSIDFLTSRLRGYVRAIRLAHDLARDPGLELELSVDAFALIGNRPLYLLDDRLDRRTSLHDALFSPLRGAPPLPDAVLLDYSRAIEATFARPLVHETLDAIQRSRESAA